MCYFFQETINANLTFAILDLSIIASTKNVLLLLLLRLSIADRIEHPVRDSKVVLD